jgi:hypothetical protein
MQHRALGAARVVFIAAAAVLLVTCTEPSTGPRITQQPSFAISDGTQSGGNPDVFFLPPLASTPHGGSYGQRPPNPNLHPSARVCTLNATDTQQPPAADLKCQDAPGTIADLPMVYGGGNYSVNWQTSDSPLDVTSMYRIGIFVGRVEVGFRDVDPDPGPPTGACKTRDDFCQFQNGSTLAIKVAIQTDAVCFALDASFNPDTDPCATASLSGGESLPLSDLSIATLGGDQSATINMQPCGSAPDSGLRSKGLVDLPTFGPCVRIDNLESVSALGTATVCQAIADFEAANPGLSPEQVDSMTHRFRVHRNSSDNNQSDTVVYALPHADGAGCAIAQGVQPAQPDRMMGELLRFASRTWRAATDRVGVWLQPTPLWAHPVPRCHAGGCGGIGGFESYYQVAQPAWMTFGPSNPGSVDPSDSNAWNLGTYKADTTLTVSVTLLDSGELDDSPTAVPDSVNNVRLHIEVNGAAPTPDTVLSGPPGGFPNGVAQFHITVAPGANTVKVWGKGVGVQNDTRTFLNVFAPPLSAEDPADSVRLWADTLVFTATGLVPLYFKPDPPTVTSTDYTSGVYTFPAFSVCADPPTPDVPVTSLEAVTNNGSWKNLGGDLPNFPTSTGANGCLTLTNVTLDGTGAFKLVANGIYYSKKFNLKPQK